MGADAIAVSAARHRESAKALQRMIKLPHDSGVAPAAGTVYGAAALYEAAGVRP